MMQAEVVTLFKLHGVNDGLGRMTGMVWGGWGFISSMEVKSFGGSGSNQMKFVRSRPGPTHLLCMHCVYTTVHKRPEYVGDAGGSPKLVVL